MGEKTGFDNQYNKIIPVKAQVSRKKQVLCHRIRKDLK